MKILKKEAFLPQLMGIRLIFKDYYLNLKLILSQDKSAPNWVQVVSWWSAQAGRYTQKNPC